MNSNLVGRAGNVVRRHWRRALRLRERFTLNEEAFHLILAGVTGVIGGVVNLLFFYAARLVQAMFLPHPGDPVEVAEMMLPWQRVLVPTLGGLAAGLILYWGLRLIGPQGSSNLLEVVVAGDGRLPFRSETVKTGSALVSIATGASIGREGGIIHLAATLSSKLGQIARWPPYRLRLLVGCGTAAGVAAAYNAPIAGAVFSALIVMGNFSMNLFAPLVVSSVTAAVVSRSFFGIEPWYHVPPFPAASPMQLPWFVMLGMICGGVGAYFLKLLRDSEERFHRLRWPIYVKLAFAGLVVGLVALEFPGVCGNGYYVTNRILREPQPMLGLGGLFAAKLLATAVTVGAGTVGGVFTPTLFLGGAAGAMFGGLLHGAGGALDLPAGAFALAGMGATLAATTRSPLLAIIMIFELSLDYSLMPPVMLACVVSTLVARVLHGESVYTEHLRLKGLALPAETHRPGEAMERTVGDLMRPPVAPVRDTATLEEIARRFLASSNNFLPVVDDKRRLLGVVALLDMKEFLNSPQELRAVIAADVMRPLPRSLTP
ncbi:MAG: chloride channel protein, partial [Verrucomicrobiota bacterium]|nr:chloride channel protein [Verrucomicrobiota bacterium]